MEWVTGLRNRSAPRGALERHLRRHAPGGEHPSPCVADRCPSRCSDRHQSDHGHLAEMRIRDVERHRTGDRGGHQWEGSYVTPETAQAPFAIASLDAVLFDFISPKRLQSVDHALQGVARLDIEFVSDLADLDGPGCFEERGCTDFISDLVHFGE